MRKLVFLVIAVAALYAGYWFVGAAAIRSAATDWLEREAATPGGLEPAYEDLSVRGFPSRFDTTVNGLEIRDAISGYGWRGAFFQMFALSYRPTEVIAIFPPEQTVMTPLGEIPIRADRMRASAAVAASTDLPLDRVTIEVDQAAVGLLPGEIFLERALLALRRVEGAEARYDIFGDVLDLDLSDELMAWIGAADLPSRVQEIRIDGTVEMSAPLDRFAEAARPMLQAIELREVMLSWGEVDVTARGDLSVGGAGAVSGEMMLEARNWDAALDLAVDGGWLTAQERLLLGAVLTGLSAGGPDEALEIRAVSVDGRLSVGGIDVGDLPRLAQRQ
ncbi:DUF2125 domain-containing protein [Aestuariibius insulae]|uniref:DUF2125 domain-containing protein n=1 Tax=Aestuariibius insulae TaxID=2058287 RepID=UPI00345E9FD5